MTNPPKQPKYVLGYDRGTWILPERVLLRSYPRSDRDFEYLQGQGIVLVVNLDTQPIDSEYLERYGLTQLHLPVADFTVPSPEQIEEGIRATTESMIRGEPVMMHCGAGLGRSGTLAACLLVEIGCSAEEAIDTVRDRRPGAIETADQEQAVRDWSQSDRHKK